jgi:hypothetical protein
MINFGKRRFVPYEDLGEERNVVVDGAGNTHTEITLSHWPKSGTPRALKADSSAEIVFNYLDNPAFHVGATAVTNNHFDEDGLVGIYTLLEPEAAGPLRDILVSVAHAGDFKVCRGRRAARIAFAISGFADAARSPLGAAFFDQPDDALCGALYRELLPRLPELLDYPDHFEKLWRAEDDAFAASQAALETGDVRIEEDTVANLAVVTLAEGWSCRPDGDAAAPDELVHPMTVNGATRCNRILTVQGRRYAFAYRYESWVQYMSAWIPPRVDLAPLAKALSADEPGRARWRADDVSAVRPRLALHGAEESAIALEDFRARLAGHLASATPAWNPYDG